MKRLFVLLGLCVISYSQVPMQLIGFFTSNNAAAFAAINPKPNIESAFTLFAAPVTTNVTYKIDYVLSDASKYVSIINITPEMFATSGGKWVKVQTWNFAPGLDLTSVSASLVTGLTNTPLAVSK